MKDLITENKKLKRTIESQNKEIQKQNDLIFSLRNNFSLQLYNAIQAIIGEYSILLNPPEIEINGTSKNRSVCFSVKTDNVIGVFSYGRTKQILFENKISEVGSNNQKNQSTSVDKNWNEIIEMFSNTCFFLCKVNKSAFINVKFYDLSRDNLILNLKVDNMAFKDYKRINIINSYKENFINLKKVNDKISSLQKSFIDYISINKDAI